MTQPTTGRVRRFHLFYWGIVLGLIAAAMSVLGALLYVPLRLSGQAAAGAAEAAVLVTASVMAVISALLLLIDFKLLPRHRRIARLEEGDGFAAENLTVVLTAYNDEASIGPAVRDFLAQSLVKRVIVVSNNSRDRTLERAREAGAIALNEIQPGYGRCVYRCLTEALAYEDSSWIALCEGDMTFRARDLNKFLAYIPHAEIVNGTRIVEQLRAYETQLSTFMYYGNFFVGKLLEAKHFGSGTFTDVGTTYKVIRRTALERLLPLLNPAINLEFNAHFLDTALGHGFSLLECPITFHARVGVSKGGNVNNIRALQVGLRMIRGISLGWRTSE